MRKQYLDSVNNFEPFTDLYESGHSPASVKSAVIQILDDYVIDKEFLYTYAVSLLANEAICIANLRSKTRWKELIDRAFEVRKNALANNHKEVIEVMVCFELAIREAQERYSLQIIFENDKTDYDIDEYAFEMFRMIGALTESVIQPFLKEYYCLLQICHGKTPDIDKVNKMDFGRVVNAIEELDVNDIFTKPYPWNVRINQWRNIAQHHSFTTGNEIITATFGHGKAPNVIEFSRHDLFKLAKELIRRLGALKSSRELTILNHRDKFIDALPTYEKSKDYGAIAELASSFATQGFKMVDFSNDDENIVASFVDYSGQVNSTRQIHCSQFIVPISNRFPGKNVEVIWLSKALDKRVTFFANKDGLNDMRGSDDPLALLAKIIDWKQNL